MIKIVQVREEADAIHVRALVATFLEWLVVRYPENAADVEEYWRVQKVPAQMENLLNIFVPPTHECLLARLDGVPVGTVMLKPHAIAGACEMNRMFVSDAGRGHRVGRQLAEALIVRAREMGYQRMILSTGIYHHEALALYPKLGFAEDPSLPDTGAGDLEVRMSLDLLPPIGHQSA